MSVLPGQGLTAMGALPAAHLHPHCPWSLPSRPVSGASRDTDAPTFLDFQFRLKITPGLCDSVRRSDERQGRPGAQEIYGQESPTCVPTLVLPPLRLVSSAGWGPSGAGVPRRHRTGLRKCLCEAGTTDAGGSVRGPETGAACRRIIGIVCGTTVAWVRCACTLPRCPVRSSPHAVARGMPFAPEALPARRTCSCTVERRNARAAAECT